MSSAAPLIVGAFAVSSLLIGYARPLWVVYLMVFFAPWQELMVDIGLRVTLYTVLSFGLVVAFVRCGGGRKWRIGDTQTSRVLAWFFLWMVLTTGIHMFFVPNALVTGGFFRGPHVRPLIQLISFGLVFFPGLAIKVIVTNNIQFVRAAYVFVGSILILAVVGWAQLFIWNRSGINPLPMGLVNTLLDGHGSGVRNATDFYSTSGIVYRMSSLGGEPRWLSQAFAFAMVLIQISWLSGCQKLRAAHVLILVFLLCSLILTISMSGLYFFGLGSVCICLFWKSGRQHICTRIKLFGLKQGFFLLGSLGVVLFLFWMGWAGDLWLKFSEHFWNLIQRVEQRGLWDDFDLAVISFLRSEPWNGALGVGLGNIHLFANAYLTASVGQFAGGTAFVADSGWLRMVSEIGVVGLLLFLLWGRSLFKQLHVEILRNEGSSNLLLAIQAVTLVAIVGYMARTSFAPIAFLALGFCSAYVVLNSPDRA